MPCTPTGHGDPRFRSCKPAFKTTAARERGRRVDFVGGILEGIITEGIIKEGRIKGRWIKGEGDLRKTSTSPARHRRPWVTIRTGGEGECNGTTSGRVKL